jgi:hypothetical protein
LKSIVSYFFCLVILLMCTAYHLKAQQITGVWKGKSPSTKIELKLVKSGDSLVGNAYYYVSRLQYKKYSIKGYFDPGTNNVIWWDDLLLENHWNGRQDALLTVADFNCPGEDEMRLDGNASSRDDKNKDQSNINLLKVKSPVFVDDWDWVIENYTSGTNDPYIIDSVNRHMTEPVAVFNKEKYYSEVKKETQVNISTPTVSTPGATSPTGSISIDDKFKNRKKTLQQVIPLTGRTIELRFYDNAQVDGDSIAVYLNNKQLFKNVRLSEQPYTVKIDANELQDDNELVMVAENLGSIPPNTALMVVEIGDKKYDAFLYSNENSSALIRFIKNKPNK